MGPGQGRRVLAAQRAEHDALFRAHYPTVVAFLARRIPVEDVALSTQVGPTVTEVSGPSWSHRVTGGWRLRG